MRRHAEVPTTLPANSQHSQSRTQSRNPGIDSTNEEETALDEANLQTSETEPLLRPSGIPRPLDGAAAEGAERRINVTAEQKSLAYLLLLALPIGGLQTAWSVEFGNITPFLQELGLSKALLSLVWIAGPLSGTLVQPWIGIKSDNYRSRYGRRKPFMVGGAIATSICLLALAWTKDIVGGFLGLFRLDAESQRVLISSQIWAVLIVYLLDFAINAVQAAIRAYLVDCVPSHQQEKANALAGVVTGIGSIVGFLASEAQLTSMFWWISDSHFKILCVLSCIALTSTLSVSCLTTKERDACSFDEPSRGSKGLFGFFKSLYRSVQSLPTQVKIVCGTQIFAWMGWFPFLFYTTTFIGTLYAQPFLEQPDHRSKQEIDEIYEEGTRRGTHAMLVFSITTLIFSVILPIIVTPSHQRAAQATGPRAEDEQDSKSALQRAAACFSLRSLNMRWLTLRRAWILGHMTFAALMWLTLLTRTPASATILVGLAGFPWAMTQWAPFALIAAEISAHETRRRGARTSQEVGEERVDDGEEAGAEAGIVLGIHNVAVAAPQVVATLVSSVVFKLLQKPRGEAGDDSTGWVLRLAGLSALAAAWCARNIREDNRGANE